MIGPMRHPPPLTNDAALLGEWCAPDGTRLVFHADTRFSRGTRDVPYWLEQSGSVLDINHRTWYGRRSGDPSSIVGEWRDESNGESWTLGSDGRYVTRFDNDPLSYEGRYEATATGISTYEYRGVWQAASGVITLTGMLGEVETGTYLASPGSLTLSLPSGTTVYQRV